MTSNQVDIAPFALPNTPRNELWFEEPRDIAAVIIDFDGPVPDNLALSYLRKTWPEIRLEPWAEDGHPCPMGWVPQDDWFNAEWQPASIKTIPEGDKRVCIRFHGLKSEFPELSDHDARLGRTEGRSTTPYDVTFRRTLGIRMEPSDASIRRILVFTTSRPARSVLRVQLDAGRDTPAKHVRTEGYNAIVEKTAPIQGTVVRGGLVALGTDRPRQFSVTVRHMLPAHPYCGDDGLLTFRLEGGQNESDAFTVSLYRLSKDGPVWFEEMGVYLTFEEDPTTYEEYRARTAEAKTLSHRVVEAPEQSYAGAFRGQPRPHSVGYNLGCPHARQRFWIETNGDVLLHKHNVTWIRGKDTDRFKSRGNAQIGFGLDAWNVYARFPDPAPSLVYNLHARRNMQAVEQRSFAVPLLTPITSKSWAGDDPMAALVRFRFRNESDAPVVAELPITYAQDAHRADGGIAPHRNPDGFITPRPSLDTLTLDGKRVYSDYEGTRVLRFAVDTTMSVKESAQRIILTRSLNAGETCEAIIKIPYIALETSEELAALDALRFDACYQEVTTYWRDVGRCGAHLITPEPPLAALHASHVAHVLVTDFLMPDGSGLVNTSVGTSVYGNFSNESCMIVHDLDERGLHEEARRRLGIWVKYQGTVPQPGNFTDYDGMYFGAGGFESGAYNQHHGWVLWCLCEHFFLSQDKAWFRSVADSVIAGADWVFRQRQNTMGDLPHSRGWEKGFLPAGSLEDVTDFYYWLSTNALTWRGVEWAARALEAIGHPESARIRREADAYRSDLIRGFEIMRRHSPLVRLRDGRWVPYYPSRLYRRGREIGWIRETLEGAVYLLISGLYDSNGREAQWILDDYQDNRYVTPPYGYAIPDFEWTWFGRSGISMQPNLLAGLMPYLDRDEPELYIWMFYNAWCACYRDEINAMVEHPIPVLGYSNQAHFKTSDEANAVSWLRYMFVYGTGDTLHLGRAIPRAWFAQPQAFEARDVVTRFGKAGIRYQPDPENRTIKATVRLDLQQQPSHIWVRFRTPRKESHDAPSPIRTARVDGKATMLVDPLRGDVAITGIQGQVEVEVEY